MLPVEPFREWLEDFMYARDIGITEMAQLCGISDERRLRCILGLTADASQVVSEQIVERIGIAVFGDPRFVTTLYPDMSEPVCQMCGESEGCHHLTGEKIDKRFKYWEAA